MCVPLMFHTRLQALFGNARARRRVSDNGIKWNKKKHQNFIRRGRELGGDLGAWAWDSRILSSDRETLLVDNFFMFVLAHARARLCSGDMEVDRQSSSYDVK